MIRFFENLFGNGKEEPEKLYKMQVIWKQADFATIIADLSTLEAIIKSQQARKKGCFMSKPLGAGILPTNQWISVTVDEETRNKIWNAIDSGEIQGVSSFIPAV